MFGFKFWAMVVGAAPLDPELEAFWGRLGFVVVQGYGLTETAPIVTLNHPLHARRGAVGKPIAGVEVKIADDGEILVRGENVTTGYFNAPEATRERVRGRLVPHRRHRRARRATGRLLHPGPQEGNDRHAGRTERLSGGRRARAQRAARRLRFGGRRRAGRRQHRGTRAGDPRARSPAPTLDAVVRAANARARRSSEDPRRGGVAGNGAAADRRHAAS